MRTNAQRPEKFNPVRKRTLALARDYVDRHFYRRFLFPIKPGAKFPPLIKNNLEDASNDPAQLEAWEKQWPGCNWAVAHRKSELLVADVDTNPKKNKVGQRTYDDLDLEYGWPDTETTTTPSGGFHKIYEGHETDEHPSHIMALGENGIGKDIDSPNYTLIPGCMLDDGTSYTTNELEAVRCPEWIYDTIKASKIKKTAVANAGEVVVELDQQSNVDTAIDFLKNDAEPSIEGQNGDACLLKAAYYLKDLGISQELGAQLLNEYFNPRCQPPWDMADFEKKMAGAYTYGNLSKVGGKTAEADFADEPAETITPMGIYDIKAGKYKLDAKKVAKAKSARDKDRAVEAATPADAKDRVWTRQQVCEEIVYVSTLERFISRTDPSIAWKVGGFDNKFGYIGKGKLSKSLFEARRNTIRRPDRMIYKPTLGEFVDGCWNQWRPSAVLAEEGDTSLWDAHLAYLFPDEVERNHLLNWMAGVLQHQEVKPMHALLLIGKMPGTGKSFVIRVLAALIGENNWQPLTQDILANGFTGWATRSKLVTVEELRAVQKTEISKKLHPWITQGPMTVNEKNLPTFVIDQVIAFAFMSNKPDAIELDNSDRRYLVLETMAKVHPGGTAYYQKLYGKNDVGGLLQDRKALGAILDQLMNRDLGKYDIAGPAPWTAAKVAMKDASANDIGQWINQHIGQKPFSNRVVTVDEITAALPKFMQPRLTMKTIREALEYLGGIPWSDQIRPDGRNGDKLRVWLLGEAVEKCKSSADVLKMYREDHGPGSTVVKARTIGPDKVGKDDAPALTDFGDALDDFGDDLDEGRTIN
jgi:hypothetical protein